MHLWQSVVVTVSMLAACSSEPTGADTDGGTTTDGSTSSASEGSGVTATAADSTGPVETGEGLPSCGGSIANALLECLEDYAIEQRECYEAGAPCSDDNDVYVDARDAIRAEVSAACDEGEFRGLSVDAVVGRIQAVCDAESSSLAWRSFGGPQASVLQAASEDELPCIDAAYRSGALFMQDLLAPLYQCLLTDQCDTDDAQVERDALESLAIDEIAGACDDLSALIAVTPETFIERTSHQVDCILAATMDDPTAIDLDCGPSNVDFDADRGEWTQVVVDGDTWGTLCGDGTEYAFWIRPAPEGEPLDRVLIALQGGGVCLFEEDCAARFEASPDLFSARDDMPFGSGIASDAPEDSPFANWTKVYLPYCTQDVFAGGGVMEDLGSITVPRYGSVNLRSSLQMVRDFLWRELDEEQGAGYRPDQLVALFGGFSAGAYGTNYNYHWLLDDLQWPRTAAFPDAGLGLDNGSPLGVSGLGLLKIPAWGMEQNLPPYCFAGECAVGPVLFEALSPRLLQVPEQQMLVLSNPRDSIQQGDAFFDDEATWINEMRAAYCETSSLPGIHWYLTSVTDESVHVVSLRPELWEAEVAGETMRDWFARAIDDPESMQSRAEEADFAEQVPGVEPFACDVAP
ncbi:MAG: pectin acetylesterase-family hydrolase [Myxococcota bacterium]